MTRRCYLLYALAPRGVRAREANRRLNDYIGDSRRGIAVYHDHFVGERGGLAVLDVRTEEELARLDDPGPLEGWEIRAHPLTFSLTAVGFAAQIDFTLEAYAGTRLERLAAEEQPNRRYWWTRREAS